jgi:hypothetical protein
MAGLEEFKEKKLKRTTIMKREDDEAIQLGEKKQSDSIIFYYQELFLICKYK